MFVTDLDGTLLDRKGEVSQRNLDAIRRLQESGVEVVPATGRALREFGHILDDINHAGHAIAAGGALIHDARDGSVALRRDLGEIRMRAITRIIGEHEQLAQLLQDHTKAGVDYLMVGSQPFDPATAWWLEKLPVAYRRLAHIDEHQDEDHTVRIGAVACERVLTSIVDRIHREFEGEIAAQYWSAVTAEAATGSPTQLLEVFAARVNKWTAIEALCDLNDLDPQSVAVVGDGLNDLEMMRHAHLSIAMANADPRIAQHAKARAGHHDADGFADAAELVLRINRGQTTL
jgi:HAD superfamily hydrolase (TIGR01484 family)